MLRCLSISAVLLCCSCAHFASAKEEGEKSDVPPIKAIEGARPTADALAAVKKRSPLEIASAEDAKKYFSDEQLAALMKQVDFEDQIVLLFAWQGSGQDRLEYTIAESFPEQISFQIKPGRTKDLRQHMKLFALRSNVKWRVK